MRIIDKRGMIFGKINVFDFLVVAFILYFLIPISYYGWKLYKIPKYQPSPQINWEQKYNEANEKITKQEKVFKEYPRIRKYFK